MEGCRSEGDLRDDSEKFEESCDGILVRAEVLAKPLDQPDSVSPSAGGGVSRQGSNGQTDLRKKQMAVWQSL